MKANSRQQANKTSNSSNNSNDDDDDESRAPETSSNGQQQQSRANQLEGAKGSNKLVFGLSSRTNRLKHDEYAESRRNPATGNRTAPGVTTSSAAKTTAGGTMNENGGASQLKIRASIHGNFYKDGPVSSKQQQVSSKEQAQPMTSQKRAESPSRAESAPKQQQSQPPQPEQKSRARSTSRSPVRRKSVERLGSEESAKGAPGEAKDKAEREPEEPAGKPAPRMLFSIPPPPKAKSHASLSSKGSVVSYAKSRIYDKPSRPKLNNPLPEDSHLLLELRGGNEIPKSILSGFKPPKQVNVSKAREKWEEGEPYARCKSRQRLAAQAGKKLLHGTWSMTSVVATQQLQLQQALAASASPGARYGSAHLSSSEQPVKVLTRGSVLERVQQFERAPTPSAASVDSLAASDDETASSSTPPSLSTSSSSSSSSASSDSDATEATIAIKQQTAGETANGGSLSPTLASKQALYKNKVSTLQSLNSAGGQPLDSVSALLAGHQSPPRSPTAGQLEAPSFQRQQAPRRLSLRRRSSSTSNSSFANIPRFYHPNGKPNTYEIELQKKNIVACFDKFPDRKALLDGPNGRRHFHSISLACGFSEYFKEPLSAYVRHQMTKSNLLHNPSTNLGVQRKQSASNLSPSSAIANEPPTNQPPAAESRQRRASGLARPLGSVPGNEQPQPQRNPLARAASVDTSTMEKLSSQNYITCDQFLICWLDMIGKCFDLASKFVHLLTFGQRKFLIPDDFVPLIQSIIDDHPGLKFLRAAPDFHMRYIQTVIARIYYCVNKSWTGKISAAELNNSNLLAVLQVLSQEEDINQITDYFSYEHFYVIYCKFWNLDQDHDLLISKEDLARHNDAAISSRIIDRIFSGIVSKQIQKTGKMSYTDFVWFLLAEEDKKHPRAIEYWFRLIDIDGDGYISMYEMEYFYYEQVRRLELMNIEALPFLDSACQILDLVNPKEKNKISLSDLKKTKMATIFFDTFVNLEKYLEHESREFVSTRDVIQDGVVISDWDRYASEEYELLVAEETSV